MGSFPDQGSVLIDFLYPVKGNGAGIASGIDDLKPERVRVLKVKRFRRKQDDSVLNPAKVANGKMSLCKFGVPADSV